jgi:PAS domain S-box-containing protein
MSWQTTCYPNSMRMRSLQELPPLLLSFLINLLLFSSSFAQAPQQTKFLFLGNKNIAPVVYLDNGIPSGVAVDIVHALEKHLSQPAEIKAMDWPEAQKLVARGEADALIQINPTEERNKIYDFSDTLLESQFSIFTTINRVGISGASSLRGLRVGVESGGLPQLVLKKDPLVQLTIIPNFLEGFKLLNEAILDAVVVDYRVGSYVLAENRIRNIKVTGEPIAFSSSSFAVKKGNENLLTEINNALRIIKVDGTYQGILDKWKPKEGIFYSREQITRLILSAAVLVLLILFLITVTWMVTLKKELTQKKAAEESLRRMNRELRAISSCNQVLIRSEDEQSLLNDICRIICDKAGYCMAWVGYVEDDDAKIVRPVAWAGNEDGYLADANITWADTERGRGPTGTAIRSGKSACVQDFAIDPLVNLWREKALLRGYRANIALPLHDESSKIFGALTIYSTEPNTYTIDEIHLLEGLAEDLAFGIMVLRSRIEHKQAEDALYDAQQVFRIMVENSPDIIARYGRDCRRTYVNPTYLRVAEVSQQELLATTPLQHSPLPAASAAELQNLLHRVIESGHAEAVDIIWPKADNIDHWYNIYAFPEFDREGRVASVMTVSRDITDRKHAEEEKSRLNAELEQRVKQRTAELEQRNAELDKMNKLFVGRELRIVELKERIRELERNSGVKGDRDGRQ